MEMIMKKDLIDKTKVDLDLVRHSNGLNPKRVTIRSYLYVLRKLTQHLRLNSLIT